MNNRDMEKRSGSRRDRKRVVWRTGLKLCAALLIAIVAFGTDEGIVRAAESGGETLEAGVGQLLTGGRTTGEISESSLETGCAGEAALSRETAVRKADGEAAALQSQTVKAKEEEAGEDGTENIWDSFVMANVENTLNVRVLPDEEASRAGYLYADCGGIVLERKDGWTKLESGELIGWARDEYLLFGEEAEKEALLVGRMLARVTGETLRIRKEPSGDAAVLDLAARGEVLELVEEQELSFSDGITPEGEWTAVDYEGGTGYVSSDFIEAYFDYDRGETMEQVEARKAAQEAEKKSGREDGDSDSGTSLADPAQSARQNMGAIPACTDDLTLLAALIQCEAGNEIYEGQVAVGAVVVNRVRSGAYPNTLYDVIFASGQFGPAGSGMLSRLLQSGNVKASCMNAAAEALSGVTNVGGAVHFRRAGSHDGIVIGNHVFW